MNSEICDVIAHPLDDGTWRSEDIDLTDHDFAKLRLSSKVQEGLQKAGFVKPSKFQVTAISLGRMGFDLKVQAKPGTGKTCVYAVIALEAIDLERTACQVIVLTPTHETAIQACKTIKSIGRFIKPGVQCFIGGVAVSKDVKALKDCRIAVGTLGRISYLVNAGRLNTSSVRLLVLDEADAFLAKGKAFEELMNWFPVSRQTMAMSATFNEEFQQFENKFMQQPQLVVANYKNEGARLNGINFFYTQICSSHDQNVTQTVSCLLRLLNHVHFTQAIVFHHAKHYLARVKTEIAQSGLSVEVISSDQSQKERAAIVRSFYNKEFKVLVTTDLMSRGVDFAHVNLVINLSASMDEHNQLHRIGRAGRFGQRGISISLCHSDEDVKLLHALAQKNELIVQKLPDITKIDLWQVNDPSRVFEPLNEQSLLDWYDDQQSVFAYTKPLIQKIYVNPQDWIY